MSGTTGEAFRELAAVAKELVNEKYSSQMELGRLRTLVLNLYANDGLAMRAERNESCADRYFCPCCGASKAAQGGVLEFCTDLAVVDHEPDCALVALRREIDSW